MPDAVSDLPDNQGQGHPVPVTDVEQAKAVTRARARDFRDLVAKYIRRHLPVTERVESPDDIPEKQDGDYGRLLAALRVIPWFLAATFLASFVWDFPGVVLHPFGFALELEGLIRVLSVSGLIGFFTNWLAITMLFNPREKRPIFGQGLIPSQRERVIYRLARAVSDELINEEIIKQKIEEAQIIPRYREMALSVTRGILEDPDFRTDLKVITADYVETVLTSDEVRKRIVEFTAEKLEEYLGEGVGGFALKAYRYLNEDDFKRRLDKAVHAIPSNLDVVLDGMDDLLDGIPARIEARAEDIEAWSTKIVLGFVENLDVYSMLMGNMAKYDERQLEDLLKKSTNEQLNYIKYVGGVLGAIGGLVIWEPLLSMGVLGTIGLTLYGLDEVLYRTRKPAKPAELTAGSAPGSGTGPAAAQMSQGSASGA
ncbi:MAG: uncharacterized membrane-anchored protein YjiN (DUF445 family) [Rhodothermales bacterium]|jgi:uncharacterized membrane-anchored protein YjiN (DUF445 family)